jgi:serine/threonine-protein kinase RsbW
MVKTASSIRHDRPQRVGLAHQTWPARPRELASIRHEVHRWLAPLGLTEDAADDIVLAINEAASNAIEHAYASASAHNIVELTFWTEPAAMCIEIIDHGQWQAPSPPELTGRGRGIPLMQRLIEAVLIRYDNRGTEVFLRHPLPDHRLTPTAGRGEAAAGLAQALR